LFLFILFILQNVLQLYLFFLLFKLRFEPLQLAITLVLVLLLLKNTLDLLIGYALQNLHCFGHLLRPCWLKKTPLLARLDRRLLENRVVSVEAVIESIGKLQTLITHLSGLRMLVIILF
jgi:hypothetical protein